VVVALINRQCLAKGTLHQGQLARGGAQCTCVAVTFLCMSSLKGFKINAQMIDDMLV